MLFQNRASLISLLFSVKCNKAPTALNLLYYSILFPQRHLPRSLTLRSPTLPPRRPCACAGACFQTTRWSTTSSTSDRCWRTCPPTAPRCHKVQTHRLRPLGVDLLSAGAICALKSAEVPFTLCLLFFIFNIFSQQGESEGDPLHCGRSVAQCSV